MAFCLSYSALSGALVSFSAPLAAGSGIPEIKTYLNGVHVRGAAMSNTHAPLRGKLHYLHASRLLNRHWSPLSFEDFWKLSLSYRGFGKKGIGY